MTDSSRPAHPPDTWSEGDSYEAYVGRWSSKVAQEFLRGLDVSPQGDWLDVGCGTGALTEAILKSRSPASVKGVDPSEAFLACARRRILDRKVHFAAAGAEALPDGPRCFDHVVSGLVLNFVPDPALAVREMARVARDGGTIAAYVWDYAGKMQFMRHFWNAAAALDPSAFALDEGRRFPLCSPEPLERLFRSCSLDAVAVRGIEIETAFKDFEDYWSPFLGGQGPAPTYAMSLGEAARSRLRERIRAGLPFAVDGSIPLVARAWAVQGTVSR